MGCCCVDYFAASNMDCVLERVAPASTTIDRRNSFLVFSLRHCRCEPVVPFDLCFSLMMFLLLFASFAFHT